MGDQPYQRKVIRPQTGATLRRRHGGVKIQVCVKLPEALVAHLDELTGSLQQSRSEVIGHLIETAWQKGRGNS
ncbi:MAG: ribbon-helix-helix protein, CopG family [Magnetococcales bacterium]|nr:ribbon-helix-helix protein, CopG family [Magnetococcales bacterium]